MHLQLSIDVHFHFYIYEKEDIVWFEKGFFVLPGFHSGSSHLSSASSYPQGDAFGLYPPNILLSWPPSQSLLDLKISIPLKEDSCFRDETTARR